MRHGPAEDQAATGRDFDRRLTPKGRRRTELVALELGARGEIPKRILTSPLSRTVETSQVVVEALGLDLEPELRDELAPGGNSFDLIRSLATEGAKRIMLVGHEPDVSLLTARLFPSWSQGFDKAMVVGLALDREACATSPSSIPSLTECRFVIEPKRLDN
jgi:phosphohistidine phosphatase